MSGQVCQNCDTVPLYGHQFINFIDTNDNKNSQKSVQKQVFNVLVDLSVFSPFPCLKLARKVVDSVAMVGQECYTAPSIDFSKIGFGLVAKFILDDLYETVTHMGDLVNEFFKVFSCGLDASAIGQQIFETVFKFVIVCCDLIKYSLMFSVVPVSPYLFKLGILQVQMEIAVVKMSPYVKNLSNFKLELGLIKNGIKALKDLSCKSNKLDNSGNYIEATGKRIKGLVRVFVNDGKVFEFAAKHFADLAEAAAAA